MPLGKIKRDNADKYFSYYIRLIQKKCQRCFSPVGFNDKGLPNTHTVSHYFGRARESVRFDPENCDVLCLGCHQEWGSTDREAYRQFKLSQLGEKGFKALTIRANTLKKKDRAMESIRYKQAVKNLLDD